MSAGGDKLVPGFEAVQPRAEGKEGKREEYAVLTVGSSSVRLPVMHDSYGSTFIDIRHLFSETGM